MRESHLADGRAPAVDTSAEADSALTVLAALRQLPVEQAAAVTLVDIEGCPVAEAAQVIGVPVGTVKSRCARGRARLAGLLTDLDPRSSGVAAHPAGDPGRNAELPARVPSPPRPDREETP